MCDVAIDIYIFHGDDGILNKGKILNDEIVKILVRKFLL
jgi:Delta-aminolevulinic acid dehydratase